MNKEVSEYEKLHTNITTLSNLIHELIAKCFEAGYKDINPQLIGVASKYLDTFDKQKLMNIFIEHSYKHWDKIKNREDSFFLEHAKEIFQYVPGSEHIESFKILYTAVDENGNRIIPQSDIDAIFSFFDSCIKICIKHIHKERNPYLKKENGQLIPHYTNKYCTNIRVVHYAKLFNLKLDWGQIM
jgi:hypothetical protein